MSNSESVPNRTLLYFLFTLLFSWAIWIPMAISQVFVREPPWLYLMMLGGLSPSMFGLLFMFRLKTYDKRGFVKTFLSFRQIGIRNLLGLILCVLIPFALSLGIDYLALGNAPATDSMRSMVTTPLSLAFALATFVYSGPITEEFGWRGYATRSLLPRLGLIRTILLIGVIWSMWHYPLLFLNGQYDIDNYWIYVPVHLVKTVALTAIMTVFYRRTGGSVLSAMIIHMLFNATVSLFYPVTLSSSAIQTVLMVVLAAYLLIRTSRKEESEVKARRQVGQ